MGRFCLKLLYFAIAWFPLQIAWNAVLDWSGSQLATQLGLKSPDVSEVYTIFVEIGLPLVVAAAAFYCYHLWWSRKATKVFLSPQDVPSESAEIIRAKAELAKQERLRHKQELRRDELMQGPAQALSSQPIPEFISMQEAATISYEQLRQVNSIYALASEKLGHKGKDETRADAIISWFAYCIAPKIPVYGKHPPSRLRELIDREEFKRGGFVNGGDAFCYHYEKEPRYVGLEVRMVDLDRVIDQLKNTQIIEDARSSEQQESADLGRGYTRVRLQTATTKEAAHVQDANLQDWLGKVDTWMHEAIDVIKRISPVDSEWFKTLDVVPLARVQVAIQFKNNIHAPLFVRIYNQHDFRLVRVDELLAKYRTNPGFTLR